MPHSSDVGEDTALFSLMEGRVPRWRWEAEGVTERVTSSRKSG